MSALFLIEYHGEKLKMTTMAEVCELQRVLASMTSEIAQSGPTAWGEFYGYPELRRKRMGVIKVRYEVGKRHRRRLSD